MSSSVSLPRSSSMLRALALVATLLLLPACASLGGGGTPADIFDLSAPEDFAAVTGRAPAQLLVPVPTAVAALATNRVVVRPTPSQIAYFPDVSWSDELPALVQAKLVRAFENSGKARAVGTPGQSLAIDYQILVDIRAFELDVPAGRTAHVALGVKLLDDRSGLVRAQRVFTVRLPAGTDSANGAIAAIDRAAGEAFTEIIAWTADVI